MILLDTNAIVYYLHRVEPYASKVKQILIERKDLTVSLRVIDEIIFTLIRLEALRRLNIKLNIKRLNQLREHIRKHDIEEMLDKAGIRIQ